MSGSVELGGSLSATECRRVVGHPLMRNFKNNGNVLLANDQVVLTTGLISIFSDWINRLGEQLGTTYRPIQYCNPPEHHPELGRLPRLHIKGSDPICQLILVCDDGPLDDAGRPTQINCRLEESCV